MKDCKFNHIIIRCLLPVGRTWRKATIVLLASATLFILSCTQPDKSEFQSTDGNTTLVLPDSTMVTLNRGARLSYAPDYGEGQLREVTIDGEAYFEVMHDPRRKFIARSNGVAVTVLGTAFNIKVLQKTGEVAVTVTDGKVNVSDDRRDFGNLQRRQQVLIDPRRHNATYALVDISKTLAWYHQGVVFANMGIGRAVSVLGARYKTRIVLENNALNDCVINFSPDYSNSLKEILDIIAISVNAEVIISGDTYIIRGGTCL